MSEKNTDHSQEEQRPDPPSPDSSAEGPTEPSAEETVEPSAEESTEPTTGRARLLAALKKPGSRGQVLAAVLLAIVGFASAVQVQATEQDDIYAGMRQEDMLQLLNSLAAASDRAENEVAELEQTRSSLLSDTTNGQAAIEAARQQANVLGILAGTLPTGGPGVVVKVDDPSGAVGTDQLLNGLEELRDAGAEAVEINDTIRVVAQTSLNDGDNGVVVDGQQLSAPYTIEAIGDPHTLAQALDFTGGFSDEIEQLPDAQVTVKETSSVEIASTREPARTEYAQPSETE